MKPEHIIEQSVKTTQEMGVRIIRGPLFIIEKRVIVGCDCSGAVLIAHGKAEQHLDSFSEG